MKDASERGTALLLVMCGLLVITAMGLSLVLLSSTETLATANGGHAVGTLYAAHAGVHRAVLDLARASDWDQVLSGQLASGFNDGLPGGDRRLADGRLFNLEAVVNRANCGEAAGCTAAQMDAVTQERPWGKNNPRWRLFGHGPLGAMLVPSDPLPDEYLVMLVADDPGERDDDPSRDGRPGNPGAGVVIVRAEAFGPAGAHRIVEATVARGVPARSDEGYAAQRGQGSVARDGAGTIQVPGGSITRSVLTQGGAPGQ